jgi:hypothetical protein
MLPFNLWIGTLEVVWERLGEAGTERLGLCICRAYSLQEARRGWERLELRGWGCAYARHIPYKRLREAGRGRERLGKGARGWNWEVGAAHMQGIFLTRDYERLREGMRGWENDWFMICWAYAMPTLYLYQHDKLRSI